MKIVCLGDSLTEGYEIDKSKRWSDLAQEQLGFEFINKGISGDTSAGMLARFYHDVIPYKPDYILIFGGTNDLSLKIERHQIIANIIAITRQAKFNNIIPIICIPTPCFEIDFSSEAIFLQGNALREALVQYSVALKMYCKLDQKSFIDFSDLLETEDFLPDLLHPNLSGHSKMSDQIVDYFRQILNL